MAKLIILQLALFWIITQAFCKNESFVYQKYNACQCDTVMDGKESTLEEHSDSSGPVILFCCANNFISRIDFKVNWTFEGSAYPEYVPTLMQNDFESAECFEQKLKSSQINKLDAGNYTCTVQGEDGSVFQKTTIIVVYDSGSYRGKPLIVSSSQDVYTAIGNSVNLSCSFFMENSTNAPNVFWRKTFQNETTYLEVIARNIPGVIQSPLLKRNGTYFSELTLKNVAKYHIGNYSCLIVTRSEVVYQNMTVFNQETPEKIIERQYEVLAACVFMIMTCLLITSCIIYRLRMDIILIWRKHKPVKKNKAVNHFSHDAFIVCGPSAQYWAYTVLLSKLEGEWLYNCFLPDRDMKAGQACIDAICQNIQTSRRTIIVVTDCLLHSSWCNFMMNHAIHNALLNSPKVLAITLSDSDIISDHSTEVQNMLKVLKLIKKIKYPQYFRSQPYISTAYLEPSEETICSVQRCSEFDDVVDAHYLKEDADYNAKDKVDVSKGLLGSFSIAGIPYSKSSSQLDSKVPYLVPHPSASLSDLQKKNDSENPWLISKNKKVANMILGSSEFQECKSSWNAPKVMTGREETVYSQRNYELSNIFDYEIPFPKCKRKKLYSESSECPLSPCSNAPFLGEEKTGWNSQKTIKEYLNDFLYGNPDDLFWKKLHLHLPSQPVKLEVNI